ncbi:MAG: LysE family translocator [Sneathiella sp.]
MTPEFLLTSLIVVLAPGTGVLYTVVAGLSRGPSAALFAAVGCTLGILPSLIASTIGLAALLHTSALLFQAIKYAGVLYLLYLAWQTLKDKGVLSLQDGEEQTSTKGIWAIIGTGIAINSLNPKLSIFFLAFLPQFIPVGSAAPTLSMIGLGAVFMAMTFVIFVFYGVFAARFRQHVLTRPSVMNWFRRGTAGAFAALGAKLAFAER